MAQSGLVEFNRMQRAMPGASDSEIARLVAKDLNTRFGNLKYESWIKSQTMKDLSRLILLAPSWNEGLLRSEIGAVKGVGKTALDLATQRRLVVSGLTKGAATAVLGMFAANQLINFITRGRPTWDNPEEGLNAKISAWIPDWIGKGPGFFLNPLALPAELTHGVVSKMEQGKDGLIEAATGILNNKMAPVARFLSTLLTQRDNVGHHIKGDWEISKQALWNLVPVPIPLPSLAAVARSIAGGRPIELYPGEMQKQLFSSAGIRLDAAPATEGRIHNLAEKFRAKRGLDVAPQFNSSDFTELTAAVRQRDRARADKAMKELLEKKTHEQIVNHFRERVLHPFTGSSLADEKKFYESLKAEQKRTYDKAIEDRAKISQRALEWYASAPIEKLRHSPDAIPQIMHTHVDHAAMQPRSLKPKLARKEL